MRQYVIIGNGAAGASAAQKIRTGDPDGQITIYTDEPLGYYYRPRLIDYLAGEVQVPSFTLHDQAWYDKNNITLRAGVTVNAVDPKDAWVEASDGSREAYDALLLATGARSFVPPVPGSDKAGVFALRTVADADQIREAAGGVAQVILVGGGLLGLEAGAALAKLGLQVQVVEFFDRLLPRQMDPAAAAMLQKLLEGRGFSFYLGARSKEITGGARADGLTLEGGAHLAGGLVLFSAGIRPNLDLAQAMGLDTDKGVKVDDRLQTSREGVWAAGDLVEHRGRIYGIWPACLEQGQVAGVNMAGGAELYQGTVMSNSLKVVGVDLTAAGEIDAEGKFPSAVYQDAESYRKIVFQDGKIAGLIFFGLTAGVKEALQAMKAGAEAAHLQAQMQEKDFDFSRLTA
ncbi:MAG: FAD-dependent oxidoreductase [Deltaproteobacteria bacterium]|nr:FAD-dependent oxidoreductase [Deltaproteobacteria bacterium]